MMQEILIDNNTYNSYFINDIQNLELPTSFNNYGKIKIRASGNHLIVIYNIFDQLYTYQFCDYLSYASSFTAPRYCSECENGGFGMLAQSQYCSSSSRSFEEEK